MSDINTAVNQPCADSDNKPEQILPPASEPVQSGGTGAGTPAGDVPDPPADDADGADPPADGDAGKSKGLKWHMGMKKCAIYLEVYPEQCGYIKAATSNTHQPTSCILNVFDKIVKTAPDKWHVHCGLHDLDERLKRGAADSVKAFYDIKYDKIHGHILIWTYKEGRRYFRFRLAQLFAWLDDCGLKYRFPEDVNLLNHTVFPDMRQEYINKLAYNYHLSYAAYYKDGKHDYTDDKHIRTNIPADELAQLLYEYELRMHPTGKKDIPAPSRFDQCELLADAFKLGESAANFDQWWDALPYSFKLVDKLKNKALDQYNAGIKRYAESDASINNIRCCIFINGAPDGGKTYNSVAALRSLGLSVLEIEGGGTGKMDSLTSSHDAIVFSDTDVPNPLQMCDNKFTRPYRRNANNPLFTGSYLIITYNGDFVKYFEEFYVKNDRAKWDFNAFRSRVFECELTADGLQLPTHISTRSGDDAQDKRAHMFFDFLERFNESYKGYTDIKKADPVDIFNRVAASRGFSGVSPYAALSRPPLTDPAALVAQNRCQTCPRYNPAHACPSPCPVESQQRGGDANAV